MLNPDTFELESATQNLYYHHHKESLIIFLIVMLQQTYVRWRKIWKRMKWNKIEQGININRIISNGGVALETLEIKHSVSHYLLKFEELAISNLDMNNKATDKLRRVGSL